MADVVVSAHALSPEVYAAEIIHILANPRLSPHVFAWNNRSRPIVPSSFMSSSENVGRVWKLTEELIHAAMK